MPRSDFEALWRALAERGGRCSAPMERFCPELCPALTEQELCLCLKVLEELGLLRLETDGTILTVERVPDARAELEGSALLRRLRSGAAAQ